MMTFQTTSCDAPAAKKFQLVGGNLCLDFTNSVGGKRGATTREHLHSYADLLSWWQQAGLVSEEEAKKLAREAERAPDSAMKVLERAVELREAIYRIFASVVKGHLPAKGDLEILNARLAAALGRMRVQRNGATFVWSWASDDCDLASPLGPIARAAAELLTDNWTRPRIHQCVGDNCGWLFVDSSKNHSRRWCDMRDCGNRAKVRRHRMKQRKQG
jgi:predicted RNA-binding Zn ribbon-like protein